MQNKRKVDICLTPSLLDLFNLSNKLVVVIDVFRATSAMCVFLNNGGKSVIPCATIDEAKTYTNKNTNYQYLVAAERDGHIVPGFDLGNSPLSYHNKNFTGLSLVITTTNGTLSISKSKKAGCGIVLASFLNMSTVCNYLHSIDKDVLFVCSGWKGRMCVEDLLLAGLMSSKLLSTNTFLSQSDSVLMGLSLYESAKGDIVKFLSKSAYKNRLNLDADIKYCLQKDIMSVLPIWSQDYDGHECFFVKKSNNA